ncbi:MAG: signal recognition particle-docking protein FtsY [Chloroflexota bacterium]|nr:signal recognition particle-docking protein FtsY [Chloroflexota bacterium]
MFGFLKKKTQQAVKRSKEDWFGKVAGLFNRPSLDDDMWEELEELLITADVGATTTDTFLQRLRDRVKREKIDDGQQAYDALREEIVSTIHVNAQDITLTNEPGHPRVILIVGVNGSGKTTSIAKLANAIKKDNKTVVLAAADTFRAAAIDQLKYWGEKAGCEVIAHQPNADPGAVVFDALEAGRTRNANTVIIDTAGRLQTKSNLMEELKKIKRVAQRVDESAPHEVLLVLDATTGQNGLSQAKHFSEAVEVTGIILTKLDSTAKGGIVLSICNEMKIPIRFIGTGEAMDDLVPFDAATFAEALTG